MAKISNTTSYPNQSPIEGADYLIGTAANSTPIDKQTKTFTIQGIADFIIDTAFDGVSYRLPVFTAATAGQESFLLVDSLLYQDTASLGGKPGEVLGTTVYINNGSGVGSLQVAQSTSVGTNLTVGNDATITNNANILNDLYVAGDSVFDDSVTMNQEIRLIGEVYDSTNTIGNNEQVLVSDANGKVTWQNYQGSGLEFQGAWNAQTNVPDLQNYPLTLDNTGKYWVVSVAGTTGLPGIGGGIITDWEPGDWAIISEDDAGNVFWDKIDNSSVLTGGGTTGNIAIWTAPRELGDAPIKLGSGTSSLVFNNGNSATGDYSNSFGDNSTAQGIASFAAGLLADAQGDYSVAMGYEPQAVGIYSVALGDDSQAASEGSVSIGKSNNATGIAAIAMGEDNVTTAAYAVSMGYGNSAALNAIAIGKGNISSGQYGVALGNQNQSTNQGAVALGRGNDVSGVGAAAIGTNNTVIVDDGFAFGKNNVVNAGTGQGGAGFAFGDNNTSSGAIGFAMGEGNTVSSLTAPSFALGGACQASGDWSIAVGKGSTSSADNSISMGYENQSSANASVALGYRNISSSDSAVGLGKENEPSAQYAVGIGYNNQASAIGTVSIGESNEATTSNAVAIGKLNKASGAESVAMGLSSNASGGQAVALGHASVASGISATAIGFESSSTGDYGTSLGYRGSAAGDYSFAAGYQANANDIGSVSLGYNNLADTQFTVAIGSDMQVNDIKGIGIGHSSNLNGEEVFGIGNSVITKSYRETVLGSFNAIAASQNGTNWINTDRLFTIGNGPSVGNESNALILTKAGNLALPTYGGGTVTGTATYNLSVDANGNVIESAIGTAGVTGSGTQNYITKWNSSSSITDSIMFEGTAGIGIGTITPSYGIDTFYGGGEIASNGIAFVASEPANGLIKIGDIDGYGAALGLYDDSSTRQALLKGGALLIGTGGAASEKLEVVGNIVLSGGNQDDVYSAGDALFLSAGGNATNNTHILIQDANGTITTDAASVMGVGVSNPQAKLDVNGGIKMGDTNVTPSAANVGTMRYRVSGNNSYVDVIMQDGASSYTWVNIVRKIGN